jgi:hypothetical protein
MNTDFIKISHSQKLRFTRKGSSVANILMQPAFPLLHPLLNGMNIEAQIKSAYLGELCGKEWRDRLVGAWGLPDGRKNVGASR